MKMLSSIIVVLAFTLSGCKDSKERWEWSVNFCGGEQNIFYYSQYNLLCRDGRSVSLDAINAL